MLPSMIDYADDDDSDDEEADGKREDDDDEGAGECKSRGPSMTRGSGFEMDLD